MSVPQNSTWLPRCGGPSGIHHLYHYSSRCRIKKKKKKKKSDHTCDVDISLGIRTARAIRTRQSTSLR